MMFRRDYNMVSRIVCIMGVIFFAGIIFNGVIDRAVSGAVPDNVAVLAAARQYLDAEVKKDYPRVYACLSPSSAYCAAHTYEAYRKEAVSSPTCVTGYRIINVTYIKENDDREKFPHVEKFAEIEVEVILFYSDTGKSSEVNIGFIFIKEGGKWYKS
jgi:hypothetical protein